MPNMLTLKRVAFPAAALIAAASTICIYTYVKSRKPPTPVPTPPPAKKLPAADPAIAQFNAIAAARENAAKRRLDQAIAAAEAGHAQDAADQLNRLISAANTDIQNLRQQLPTPQTRPATAPAARPADNRIAREILLAQLDRHTFELAKTDAKLAAREIAEQQWLSAYEAALHAQPDTAANLLERIVFYHGRRLTTQRLWKLLAADLPANARAVLAMQLAAYHPPGPSATPDQCASFYEALIARTVDVPVLADGLLDRYIQELDKRQAHEHANHALDSIIAIAPTTRLGARAAALRIIAEPGPTRDKLVQTLRETYPSTEIANALHGLYIEMLAKENRFVEAFQATDADGALARAATAHQLLQTIAELAQHASATNPLLCSYRRIAPHDALAALAAFSPTQLCIGLAEELTGAKVEFDPNAQPTTNPTSPAASTATLVTLLEHATKGLPAESIRQTMLAGAKKPDTPDPAALATTKIAPQRLYEVTWQANFLNSAGKSAQAVELYKKLVEESAASPDVAIRARMQLVELLMRQELIDTKELEKQLDQIAAANPQITAPLWNLRLRVLIYRVMSAPAEQRQSIWNTALPPLAADPFPLTDESLADLDQLPSRLGGKAPFSTLNVLTDLLLLAPDFDSMHRLQSRRIAALLAQDATDDLQKAITLDLAFASLTAQGPPDAASLAPNILRLADKPPDQLPTLQSAFRAGLEPPTASEPAIDSPLRQAAAAALKAPASTISPRRKAFLLAMAGQTDDALRHAHALLNQSPASETVFNAFDFIAAILAAADGSFHHSNRFTQWLADQRPDPAQIPPATAPAPDRLLALLIQCETKTSALVDLEDDLRNDGSSDKLPAFQPSKQFDRIPQGLRCQLAKAALRRWGQHAVAWGTQLLPTDQPAALTIWLTAVNTQRHRGYAAALLDLIAQSTQTTAPDANIDQKLQLLENMIPRLRMTDDQKVLQVRLVTFRRQSGLKIAKDLFDEGNYAQCLASLDELDKKCPEINGIGDMATGFMRALCLIRLEKLDQASQRLAKMEAWPGSAEQRARALFLTGWIHLQTDDKPKALAAFRRVVDNYPQTSFAPKAAKLAAGME